MADIGAPDNINDAIHPTCVFQDLSEQTFHRFSVGHVGDQRLAVHFRRHGVRPAGVQIAAINPRSGQGQAGFAPHAEAAPEHLRDAPIETHWGRKNGDWCWMICRYYVSRPELVEDNPDRGEDQRLTGFHNKAILTVVKFRFIHKLLIMVRVINWIDLWLYL